MADRNSFIINALIDVVLDWTDGDSKLAIIEMIDKGIQPNELLGYFDANTIVEALSDNETPPEITAKEVQTTDNESDYKSTIKLLEKIKVVYDDEELGSEKRIAIFDGDESDDVNEFVIELFFEPNGTFSGYNL